MRIVLAARVMAPIHALSAALMENSKNTLMVVLAAYVQTLGDLMGTGDGFSFPVLLCLKYLLAPFDNTLVKVDANEMKTPGGPEEMENLHNTLVKVVLLSESLAT